MSPVIHAAAYRELGLPYRYTLSDEPDEAAFGRALERLRTGALAGANVTIPYKRAALRLADRPDPVALAIGAANVLHRAPDAALVAYNTDVPALTGEIERLRAHASTVLILGNGGGALGALAAAQRLGASSIAVSARRFRRDTPPTEWPEAAAFTALGAALVPWPEAESREESAFVDCCRRADVVIQATSAGMRGADPGHELARAIPWNELRSDAVAYDLVYNPPETPFLRAARARGLAYDNGLGMLVGQAALAIEIWLGVRPPREPLYAAARAALLGSP